MKNLIVKNFLLKILSLLFALTLWLFVNLKATADRSMKIPVILDSIPSVYIITNTVSDYVNVKVDGPWRIISNLNPNEFPIHLDLSDAKAGVSNYQINEKMVQLPAGMKATILFPDTIQVKLENLVTKEVPVRPNIKEGSIPEGYAVQEVMAIPKMIVLAGAKSEISALSMVETEEVDLAGRKESFEAEVNLVPKEPHVWPSNFNRRVKVRVIISEKIVQKEFLGLPVILNNAPAHATIEPANIDVLLEGPATKIEKIRPAMVQPEATVPMRKGSVFKLPVVAVVPEQGVRAKCRPDRVTVTILSKVESH